MAVGIDSKDFRGSSQVTIDFLDKSPPPHVHVLLGGYFFFILLPEKHDSFSEMEILDKNFTSLLNVSCEKEIIKWYSMLPMVWFHRTCYALFVKLIGKLYR